MTTIHVGDCSTDCSTCKANCSCGSCDVFGWNIEDGVICRNCGKDEKDKTEADPEGYPDGFTCLDCGDTVGAEHYEGE